MSDTLDQIRTLTLELAELLPARRAALMEQAHTEGATWAQVAAAAGMGTQHGAIKNVKMFGPQSARGRAAAAAEAQLAGRGRKRVTVK